MTAPQITEQWSQLWRPPVRLTLSQWAERHFVLSPEYSASTGELRLYGWQRHIFDSFTDPTVNHIVLRTGTQLVKCLATKTPIPTPTGWTTMGEIVAGDQAFDEKGTPCNVVRAGQVFENRECYQFRFDDGESIVSDEGHYWVVFDRLGEHSLVTTGEIARGFDRKNKGNESACRYRIQVAQPLCLPDASLPIDPYLLGCWLGDGDSLSSTITTDLRDEVLAELRKVVECDVQSVDSRREHVARIHPGGNLRAGTASADTVQAKLRALGLIGNKHIPVLYLRASKHQRLSLLQGFLDTDGCPANAAGVTITQKSRRLAEDIVALARTLGMKPTIRTITGRCVSGGVRKDCGEYHSVYFSAYIEDCPFRIPRKAAQITRSIEYNDARKTEARRRSITECERVMSVPVRCIEVDSPSRLYLAGHGLVPTHNTLFIQCAIAYVIAEQPGPMLVAQPKEDDAKTFSKERIAPMLRDIPALRGKVGEATKKDSDSTILYKAFPGGVLSLVGAGAPGNAARRSIQYAFLDEVNKYAVSAEGNFVKLAKERLATYGTRRKLIETCSPTTPDGEISQAYEESDQCQPWVACWACGERQMLDFFRHVKWNNELPVSERPATAYIECEHCNARWNDLQRVKAAGGAEWIAQKPFAGIRGYGDLSHLLSPWKSLREIVAEFFRSKDNPNDYRVFTNTNLAKDFENRGESPEWRRLYERSRNEPYRLGIVPEGALFLTAGVDVQGDRIEVQVKGWGRGKQSWIVDYVVLEGKPNEQGVWAQLAEVLGRVYPNQDGVEFNIAKMAIDSGYATQDVYAWARQQAPGRVMVVKGMPNAHLAILGQPSAQEVNLKGKKIVNGIQVWGVGSGAAKTELYGWLQLPTPTEAELSEGAACLPGYCHLSPELAEEFYEQLTAEELVAHKVKGYTVYDWQKKRDRNEALDTAIYARAAASQVGIDRFSESHWVQFEAMIGARTVAVKKLAIGEPVVARPRTNVRGIRWQMEA